MASYVVRNVVRGARRASFGRQLAPLRSLSYNANIDSSKTEVTLNTAPKAKTPEEELVFGKTFTDHMLEIDWNETDGWSNPVIKPYGNFDISPAASCFHYGLECFEGMKAYKNKDGEVLLFRPDRNMWRLNSSMSRLAMPEFDGEQLTDCIKQLLRIDESWVPSTDGYSMYLRPTAIGTSAALGVTRSDSVRLYVIMCPVGPYYKSGFVPIKLFADADNVRAWPGGTGNAKLGGNYGPTILPSYNAMQEKGCQQILWLFGDDHEVTEVGAMNIFFLLKNKDGKGVELVTAPLTRGDILPGVTRQSILELARGWGRDEAWDGDLTVSERWLTMKEIQACRDEGRLLEAFGAGTAVVVSPVSNIVYEQDDIAIPTGDKVGAFTKKVWKTVTDIQKGAISSEWSVPVGK